MNEQKIKKTSFEQFFQVLKLLKEYILVLGFFASIFVGAVALIVTYRFAPVFKSIETITGRVEAIDEELQEHEDNSIKMIGAFNQTMTEIKESISGTRRDSINSRLSRIEGAIQK